ncbi:MAG: iron-containing alcohol dehydrogenase [Butyrivibrio sp.]|nr:iron-containing alcohol dehydrogenase [Butyrivibrio sp.]
MNFYIPTKVFTEIDVITNHKRELISFGKRCFIVTGKHGARSSGALDDVEKILNGNGVVYDIFDEIGQNPLMSLCIKAGRQANTFGADYILGIGGGSALDAAKVVAAVASNPELEEGDVYAKSWKNAVLPIVLVGTTAGTGSEVTKVAVLTTENGIKKSMNDDSFYASLALGDPRYTASMSSATTASTAIDALAHLVESYFSNKANDISRAFSVKGCRMLIDKLQKIACGEELTLEDRAVIYDASIVAGMAIAVTGTTFAHNVGYYFTENYNIPHGFASAMFMPELLKYEADNNADYSDDFYEQVGYRRDVISQIVQNIVPKYDISFTDEKIESVLPRWENNNSVKNTKGAMNVNDIKHILKHKFR